MGRPAEAHRLRVAPYRSGLPGDPRAGWLPYLPVTEPYPLAREFQGISYSLLATPDAEQARFAFSGSFQDEQIIWDATLLTLARYHDIQPDAGQPVARSAFLEIGGKTAHGRAIRVALDITLIDEAAILRTIIMIRNYKRLRPGRHEFGEPRVFPPRAAG